MSALFEAMLPVIGLIVAGFFAGHRQWVDREGARQLAALGFGVLCPALLFRTMATMNLDLSGLHAAILAYLGAELLIFTGVALSLGRGQRALASAMTSTFGNTVMIGVPLVGLAFGEQGLVVLLAIVSAHSLLMLSVVTVLLELLGRGGARPQRPHTVAAQALRRAILHPITLPILLGLAWGQTASSLPALIDHPLQWLGQAFSPLALLMVGISLAHIVARTPVEARRRIGSASLGFVLLKNLVHPLLAGLLGLALGLRGLPLAVTIAAAALPIGATVLIIAQRYQIGVDQATAAIAASTFAALITLPLALLAGSVLR